MGHFPLAIVTDVRKGSEEPLNASTSYACDSSHNMIVEVQLMKRLPDGSAEQASEQELLKEMNAAFELSERARWGTYESKMIVHLRLEFAPPTPEAAETMDLRINAKSGSSHCAFKRPVPHGKLLCPYECANLYTPNDYEKELDVGRAVFRGFKINKNVSQTNHEETHKGLKYNLVARVVNPFLVNIPSLTVRSVPFRCKATLLNRLKSKQRWVRNASGEIVPSPSDDIR